jgi:hypothetical protein
MGGATTFSSSVYPSLQDIFCINGVVLDIMTATQLHNPTTTTRGGSLQSQEQ